jgi:hypothetical protein
VIAQGSKEVLLGDYRYQYDPMHYLLATVELPIVGQILEASKERPYLSLRLDLDPTVVGSVIDIYQIKGVWKYLYPCCRFAREYAGLYAQRKAGWQGNGTIVL